MKFLTRVLYVVAAAALWQECSGNALVAAASAPVASKSGNPAPAGGSSDSDVQVLTDSNFEQETQAVTGSTSGDWFVKFYAPWCGHCRKMAPAWEELATKLKGQINVAHLDATANPQTAKRFGIRGFPSLVFLKDGQMYEHKGSRTVEELYAFATGKWKNTTGKPIPPVMSWFDSMKDEMLSAVQQLRDMFIQFPVPLLLLLTVGCCMGAMVTCLGMMLCSGTKSRDTKLSKSSKKKD